MNIVESNDILLGLTKPFPPRLVSWRIGATNQDKTKGLALAYIDARDVMNRLDEVVSPANWQCDYPHASNKTVCRIGIKINNEWVWKADGAGDTDHEAEKGAMSDAFKRAAVRWGIGRYLYDIENAWVHIEGSGKSFRIKETEFGRLSKLLPSRTDGKEIDDSVNTKEPTELAASALKLKADVDALGSVSSITDYMLSQETKVAMEQLSPALREMVRAHAAQRLHAWGWKTTPKKTTPQVKEKK